MKHKTKIVLREQASVTMELTPEMEKQLTELFDIEIEIMQGSREKLADGRSRIEINVPSEKAELIASFCLRVIGRTDKICYN